MTEPRYLHSPDPRIRRWSAIVYAMATGAATLAWAGWGGLDALGEARILTAAWLVIVALIVWFVVAGIGLRIVRSAERRERTAAHSVD
jgi:uncharacterized membrane protein